MDGMAAKLYCLRLLASPGFELHRGLRLEARARLPPAVLIQAICHCRARGRHREYPMPQGQECRDAMLIKRAIQLPCAKWQA